MSRRKTTEEFKNEVKEKVGDEYVVLGEYTTNKNHIEMYHTICKKSYTVTPNHFINRGHRCPHCSKLKKKTTEEVRKEIKELSNGEYELKSEYKSNNEHIQVKHIQCNTIYSVTRANFIEGYRCPNCFGKKQKTTKEFKKEVEDLGNGEYKLLSEYKNNKTKVEILHKKCNRLFHMRPNDFQQGNRCPYCSTIMPHGSKGIISIRNYLNEQGYDFDEEVTFPDCKYIKRLRFDFVIYNKYNEILFIVEYDGKQHYQPTFNNEKKFNEQQIRDEIKNNYCKENNYKLIRISYKEKDIPNYLNKCLTTIENLC